MATAEEVVELKLELEGEAGDREDLYDELERAYGGGTLSDRQRKGAFPTSPEDPHPDRIATERGTPEVVVNRCRSMVEATRNFIGQMFTVRVPPPDSDDMTLERTEKQECVCVGMNRWWNMPSKMLGVGLYASWLGTAIAGMWPNMEKKRPQMFVRSPRGFYCIPKDEDGNELAVAMFVNTFESKQAKKMFGTASDAPTTDVIQYIDEKEACVVIEGKKVRGRTIQHKLDFTPVLTIPNIGIPGSPFGESTIALAVKLQQEYNYIYSMIVSTAQEQQSQPLVLPNGAQWPRGLPNGPRDVIELPEGATNQAAYRIPAMKVDFDVFRIADSLSEEMSAVADVPQAMSSDLQSKYLSGSGFQAQLGPIQAQLKVRMDTIYPRIERLYWMAFKMIESMWAEEEYTVYGQGTMSKPKDPFTETFTIDEFEGWYEFEVSSDPMQYFDEQTRWVMTLQAIQNQLLSKETAMQYFPLIKNLTMEKERIDKEVQRNIEQTMAAQAMAESAATQNAPMNEPQKTNYFLDQGYMGETQPAPVPGGLPTEGGMGGPSGPEQEIHPVVQQAADLLRNIPNIKGRVFIIGDFLDPAYLEQTSGMGSAPQLGIAVTDTLDKQTILNAVQNGPAPELHGNIAFEEVVGEPAEPFIEVTPGTSGYEVVGQTAPQEEGGVPLPEGGLPQEAGLLGGGLPEAGEEAPPEEMIPEGIL